MRHDETVFRCAVCNFETGFGNVINDHMIVQHTEIRVVTAYRPDRIYITVVKKTARDNPTAIDDGVMIETLFNQKLREKNGPSQKKYLTLRSDNMPLEVWRKERMQTDIAAIEKIEADEALQVLLDETCDMETCMT